MVRIPLTNFAGRFSLSQASLAQFKRPRKSSVLPCKPGMLKRKNIFFRFSKKKKKKKKKIAGHLINKGKLKKKKKKKKKKFFFRSFFLPENVNFSLFEIVLLQKLFKPPKNICFEPIQNVNKSSYSRLEQRSIIKFLLADKCKPCEIYKRMCNVIRSML